MNEKALSIVEALTPEAVFHTARGVEDIVAKLERDVRALVLDPTSEKGRKQIKSVAYQVARSKTALDDMGKEVKSEAMQLIHRVDAERKIITTRLDALRDEVRKPVIEFEEREKARVQAHRDALASIKALEVFNIVPDEAQVREQIAALGPLMQRDFEEFEALAIEAHKNTENALETHLQAAELRRIKREQKEAEERGAAQAWKTPFLESVSSASDRIVDRADVLQWQKDNNQFFDATILEIVTEYADWRDKKETKASAEDTEGQEPIAVYVAELEARIKELEAALTKLLAVSRGIFALFGMYLLMK